MTGNNNLSKTIIEKFSCILNIYYNICYRARGTFYVAYDDPDNFCRYDE
jgi:hypothetical protein